MKTVRSLKTMQKENYTLLIVEDNQSMSKLLISLVNVLGYPNTLTAENGVQAWGIIQQEQVDIILCDLIMPVMNGLDLLRKIRRSKKFYSLPFIMITGADNQSEIMYTLQSEVDHYMLKPPNAEKLDELLSLVVRQKKNPTNFEKAIIAGKYFYLNKNFNQAIKSFQIASQIQPDHPTSYYYMGKIYRQMDKDDLAIQNYTKSISLSGLYINALLELADIYEQRQDDGKLIPLLQKVVQLLPENINIKKSLGAAYGRCKDKNKASTQLQKAVKLTKGDRDQLEELIEYFIEAGLYDEADDLFLRKYREEDKDEIAYFWNRLGNCCREEKALSKAKNFYLSALKYCPQDMETNLNLTRLLIDEKDYQGAKSYVNKILRLFPGCSEAKELRKNIDSVLS
ncbi:MAG: response regulator [Desulfobulbaceae bacterium]|nr:response regulator [Desulfobulbaceae bacterium]